MYRVLLSITGLFMSVHRAFSETNVALNTLSLPYLVVRGTFLVVCRTLLGVYRALLGVYRALSETNVALNTLSLRLTWYPAHLNG